MNEDDEKTEIVTYSSCDPNLEEPILRLIETALEVDCYENLMKNYCKDTSILHFVFCCDVNFSFRVNIFVFSLTYRHLSNPGI